MVKRKTKRKVKTKTFFPKGEKETPFSDTFFKSKTKKKKR